MSALVLQPAVSIVIYMFLFLLQPYNEKPKKTQPLYYYFVYASAQPGRQRHHCRSRKRNHHHYCLFYLQCSPRKMTERCHPPLEPGKRQVLLSGERPGFHPALPRGL